MIDAQMRDQIYRDTLKENKQLLEKIENKDIAIKDLIKKQMDMFEELQQWKESYRSLWKKNMLSEKLNELNMKDLWDIADQRDWYYEEYRKLKDKLAN